MRQTTSILSGALLASLATSSGLWAQGYGTSVAVGEDEVVVAEPLVETGPGAVFVYSRSGGEWVEGQRVEASDASQGDHFGRALALDGTTLIVGATVRENSRGAAYAFERGADGVWTESQLLLASDGADGDAFGRVVAIEDDLALVSTWGHAEGRGAVYVFRRDATGTWTEAAKLMGSDSRPNDWFGMSLALDGETILVGAPQKSGNRGAVYVFRRDAESDSWVEEAMLSEELPANASFGMAVALSGGHALVGAPGLYNGSGLVFDYRLDGEAGWVPTGALSAFDAALPGALFGSAIVDMGPEVWISAPGAGRGAGAAYVYRRDEGEWRGTDKVLVENDTGDRFATALAVGARVAVAGAVGDDYGAGTAVIIERGERDWAAVSRVWSEAQTLDPLLGGTIECSDGKAAVFDCSEVDVLSFLPVREIGGSRGVELNDVWGWVDPETGREYALVGRMDGTSFIDVTDAANPTYLGNLPKPERARANVWRDVKVYADHAYVVADGAGEHGMQVFDLRQLREVTDGPVTFEETAHYDRIHSAHNIVINEDTGFAYSVGSNGGGDSCGGGLHMIDIRSPSNPVFAGCFFDTETGNQGTGYSHDAQCVTYHGPDPDYQGREICFGANETALSIADVTDKAAPVAVASASYPNVGYSHQGWLDEEHRYLYMNDELDESAGTVVGTRTLVWDVTDLDDPILVKEHFAENGATDHNLYVKGDLMYQSNYLSGLRVLDISDRENPVEVGYFDTVPWGEDTPQMDGSWSNYPYFESGTIVVTSQREGVFLLQKRERNLLP